MCVLCVGVCVHAEVCRQTTPQGFTFHSKRDFHHQLVSLRGIAWPGFNQQPPGLEGLAAGQLAAMEATDLHAIVY